MDDTESEAEKLESCLDAHLTSWCADCGREADVAELRAIYQRKHERYYPGPLRRFCKNAAAKLIAEDWRFPHRVLPYCPECWAKRERK